MNSWKDLESYAAKLIIKDNPVLPKGSGNAKSEEDVISDNIIVQCKYTENINTTILQKDMNRLLEACALQDKFPLFINSTNHLETISIPVTPETKQIINKIIDIIVLSQSLENLYCDNITTLGLNNEQISNKIKIANSKIKKYKKLLDTINLEYNEIINKISSKIDTKEKNLLMYNLFEGDLNGTK